MQLTSISLSSILDVISKAATALGLILLLWGGIGIGLSIKDGQGLSMDTNVGKLVGGALIVAFATGFTMVAGQSGVA